MTLDVMASFVFVLGLAAVGVWAWSPRATSTSFCVFAIGVWMLGVMATNSAFYTRGSVWLREPMRRFTYELKSSGKGDLGQHHRLLAPAEVERLPSLFDQQSGPVALTVDFKLQPTGKVAEARIARSSGNPILDSATASSIKSWNFGSLPPTYANQHSETVSVTVENRYEFLRQSRTLLLSLGIFVVGWLATVMLLPQRASDDEYAQGLIRRALTIAGFLAGIGWILIWRLAPDFNRFDLPAKQLEMMVGSFVLVWAVFLIVSRTAFSEFLVTHSAKFVGLGVILLLVTRFFGTDLGTGHRLWIRTPFGPFQTVEFVKLLLLFFVAGTAYNAAHSAPVRSEGALQVSRLRPWSERYRGMIGGFILVFGALVLMGDFGPLLLLALLLLALVWAQGYPRQSAIGFVALLTLLTVSYGIGVPARWHDRVTMWRQPWTATKQDSTQLAEGRENIARVLWSVSSGGLTGQGLGQGYPDDVEAVESDFIFSAIAEELGWLGGGAILSLILVLAMTGLQLAHLREDALAKTLASGLGLLMGVQAALTIGGNLALWPLTGITLPFLSYGRSSLLISFVALGLLIGLAPMKGRQKEEQEFPFPERIAKSLHHLQIALPSLFLLLLVKEAWLQWPVLRDKVLTHQHQRKDATFVSNPRLDGQNRLVSTHIVRGSILDHDGRILTQTTPRGRQYNDAELFSTLIGMQESGQKVGLERFLEGPLMGQWDVPGSHFRLPRFAGERRGFDVRLTLDQKLQRRAYELLQEHHYRGCIVGVEPATGKILFAVSNPAPSNLAEWLSGYDANPGTAKVPFAYRTWYEPGSTFKTMTGAAALDMDLASPNEQFQCRDGYFPPGGGEINDDGHEQHGRISLSRAMQESCNQTFAQVGMRLEWNRFWDFTTDAGLNTEWPLLPTAWRPKQARSWLKTTAGQLTAHNAKPAGRRPGAELARSAIGQQDVRVTPLYLATWTAAIANGGELMPPTLVSDVTDPEGRLVATPPTAQPIRVMSSRTASRLTDMMERVVTRGTGRPTQVAGIRIAAKTGTPQLGPNLKRNNALFIAFAPVEKPKIAIAVVIEGLPYGGKTGGPLAAELIRTICR
ncbi:penicillin-binding protein A [Abditibacteriota bacterium]|nr:penicillin-binding protein A [Abditibacteriota bacterium]